MIVARIFIKNKIVVTLLIELIIIMNINIGYGNFAFGQLSPPPLLPYQFGLPKHNSATREPEKFRAKHDRHIVQLYNQLKPAKRLLKRKC